MRPRFLDILTGSRARCYRSSVVDCNRVARRRSQASDGPRHLHQGHVFRDPDAILDGADPGSSRTTASCGDHKPVPINTPVTQRPCDI